MVDRRMIAESTMAFFFEWPADVHFMPGQCMDFTLTNPPETDAEGNVRTFSIASAPHEKRLMVATRMRPTAFKRVLGNLPLGSEMACEGPFGDLVLPKDATRPVALLAGGIGITPFRSMVAHAAHEHLPHRLYLFYSNRRPEDAAFLDELRAMQRDNPQYTLIGTMTAMDTAHRPWQGETGVIDRELLAKYLKDVAAPIYYLAGPPGMVSAMQVMLRNAGVKDTDIRAEEFAGY